MKYWMEHVLEVEPCNFLLPLKTFYYFTSTICKVGTDDVLCCFVLLFGPLCEISPDDTYHISLHTPVKIAWTKYIISSIISLHIYLVMMDISQKTFLNYLDLTVMMYPWRVYQFFHCILPFDRAAADTVIKRIDILWRFLLVHQNFGNVQ